MRRQRGSVLLALVSMLALALSTLALARTTGFLTASRQRATAVALAHAREGLIAFALTVAPDTAAKRPGDLPCPDLDNDGDAEATCLLPQQRLGRLPWKTLGMPDLRDGDGERLWYAVSVRFKRNHTNACPVSGGSNCLNSDTSGTLTLRDQRGTLLHDGSTASGAIAIVISPGSVLTRLGEAAAQSRECAGDADLSRCLSTGRCSSVGTALCNPVNYLDRVGPSVISVLGAAGGEEDNADIVEGRSDNGFIQGPIYDASANVVLNDRAVAVRYQDILPALEARIARTVLRCLSDFAASSSGRFPWAAAIAADYTSPLIDQPALAFGRLPNLVTNTATLAGMSTGWSSTCPIALSLPAQKWWANWQNLVFFAIAPVAAPDSSATACGTCLSVMPPSSLADKRLVVLVSARALSGQIRGVGADPAQYLEEANAAGGALFTQRAGSASFNDRVLYQ